MKIKYEEIIYDVVGTYSQGVRIEKPEDGYRYIGVHNSSIEVIDDSPIEYVKTKQFMLPKKTLYSKTKFMNVDYEGEFTPPDNDTIIVYNNVVIFYSPAKHSITMLDIKASNRSAGYPIWGFERHEDGTISLSPSIKSTQHEFCEHYFIKRNKVVSWCSDSWETVYIKKGVQL